MLVELLKHNRLANKEELVFLLFNALSISKKQRLSDLKQYCVSNHFSIGQAFDGTIKLLEFMEYITIFEDIVSINEKRFVFNNHEGDMPHFESNIFIENIFQSLNRDNSITNFIKPDAIKRDPDKGVFYLRESLIPFEYFGIRNLLISLGMFEKVSDLRGSNFFIKESMNDIIETLVIAPIREEEKRNHNKKLSLINLKNKIEAQEAIGKDAEIFVVNYETTRLHGHPKLNQIQRISDGDVGAGFDIESFNDNSSVFLDRFIEVKSYSQNQIFYWSRNEVETAKELSEKYFLYLVDRNKMTQQGYAPKIFQNPYTYFFENDFHSKETEVWKINMSKERQLDITP